MNNEPSPTNFWSSPLSWFFILGVVLLVVLGAPNLRRARMNGSPNTCIANLKQLDGAKEQWALETKKSTNDVPTWADLIGTDKYIKNTPRCPTGGTYKLNRVDTPPVCSIGKTVTPPHALPNP